MRPYREYEGRAIRSIESEEGNFPCGCAVILAAIIFVFVLVTFAVRANGA